MWRRDKSTFEETPEVQQAWHFRFLWTMLCSMFENRRPVVACQSNVINAHIIASVSACWKGQYALWQVSFEKQTAHVFFFRLTVIATKFEFHRLKRGLQFHHQIPSCRPQLDDPLLNLARPFFFQPKHFPIWLLTWRRNLFGLVLFSLNWYPAAIHPLSNSEKLCRLPYVRIIFSR